MNSRKTSRKNALNSVDLSCSSTSSTSKTSFEDSNDGDNEGTSYDDDDDDDNEGTSYDDDNEGTSYEDDEDTLCDDDDGNNTIDDEDGLLQKLGKLRLTLLKKNTQITVLTKNIESKNVSKFVKNLLFNKKLNDSISKKQKRTILGLYEKNMELCKRLMVASEKNRERAKKMCQLYVCVKDLMNERRVVWEEAVKLHKMHLGDSSAFVSLDDLDAFNETNFKENKKEFLFKAIDCEVVKKAFHIVQTARILYNLICNSGTPWGRKKNLLQLLECVSKLFDHDFDLRKPKEFKKVVDEVTYGLNKVKI